VGTASLLSIKPEILGGHIPSWHNHGLAYTFEGAVGLMFLMGLWEAVAAKEPTDKHNGRMLMGLMTLMALITSRIG
jgi:hypothetical protein